MKHALIVPGSQMIQGLEADHLWSRLARTFFNLPDYSPIRRDLLWNITERELPEPYVSERGGIARLVEGVLSSAEGFIYMFRQTGSFVVFKGYKKDFLEFLSLRPITQEDDWYIVFNDWTSCLVLTSERWDQKDQMWIIPQG